MSEGSSFGIALGRKLRTLSAKDLPLTPRAVLRAMADRADADGVLYPALETIAQDAGTYPPTVRRALDWLDLAGWFEVLEKATARKSARYRLRLEPAPRTGKPADRSPWRDRETTTIPQGDDGSLPGCSLASPRETMAVSQGDDSDRSGRRLSSPKLTGSSQEAHKEAPIAHAREHTRGDRPAQMGIPFGPSEDATPPEPAKAAEKPPRPKTPAKPSRKLATPEPELARDDLIPAERKIHDAITADPTLSKTTRRVPQLARDLAANGPCVDIAAEVARAGGWCRANPQKRRPNGNAFLLNWIGRAEEKARENGATPQAKPDPEELRRRGLLPTPCKPPPRPAHIQAILDRKSPGDPRRAEAEAMAALDALDAKMTGKREPMREAFDASS